MEHVRSPFIKERRRTLFPADDQDVDSELGLFPLDHSGSETPTVLRRTYSESMSPLILSPSTPTVRDLKTPHDSSIKVIEKEQKVLTEESKSMGGRRSQTPSSSPEGHVPKLSRVRTALFSSENEGVPAKSFYSKEALQEKRFCIGSTHYVFKPVKHQNKSRSRREQGEINKGVKHNIRKPKPKKALKGAAPSKTLPDGNVLNEYLQDLAELKKQNILVETSTGSTPRRKLINTFSKDENKENVPLIPSARKRAASPQEYAAHKIFKSDNCESSVKETSPIKDFQDDDPEPPVQIDNILSLLSSPTSTSQVTFNEQPTSHIILQAHSSVSASENSIQLHVTDSILSPISQMCDVTSGLALNSPTRISCSSRVAKMLSFTDNASASPDMAESGKLFPIFYKDQAQQAQKRPHPDETSGKAAKRLRGLPRDQMLLDAGQKKFGLTLCNECQTVYHMGDPNDELQHSNYHSAINVLRFCGWKNERVVADFHADGRIVKVVPGDSAAWIAKVKSLMGVINRDLGCYEMESDVSRSQVYLYVKNRMITGCAVATVPDGPAYRMLTPVGGLAMCSEESYPVKCGVSSIWVASQHRRQGIASSLMDAVKRTFVLGEVLSNSDVAITTPTEAGAAFAEKYFKTDNYLVYFT